MKVAFLALLVIMVTSSFTNADVMTSSDMLTREFLLGPVKSLLPRLRAAGLDYNVDGDGMATVWTPLFSFHDDMPTWLNWSVHFVLP